MSHVKGNVIPGKFISGAIAIAVVGAVIWPGWGQVAGTRPAFTIGRETTVVDGPVNADGTIDYVAAMNALYSRGVTAENNAAIPLLAATGDARAMNFERSVFDALKIPIPEEASTLDSLEDYAKSVNDPTSDEVLGTMDDAILKAPWTDADYPLAAAWLKASGKAFVLMEEGCGRTQMYIPVISTKTPASFSEALPPLAFVREVARAMTTRAMYRVGMGDVIGGLADLRRTRLLARLSVKNGLLISYLVGMAVDYTALQAYQGILAKGALTAEQLQEVKKAISEFPVLPEFDYESGMGERFDTLDALMKCIRGDTQEVMQSMADTLGTEKPKIDLGNFAELDWDIVLREVNRSVADAPKAGALTRDKRIGQLEALINAQRDDQWPESGVFVGSDKALSGPKPLEAFLKRRAGETVEAYSRRIGRWLGEPDPVAQRRIFTLHARVEAGYQMALTQISLAEYRALHGVYPRGLEALGGKVPEDPVTGKALRYRQENGGYVMWSAGLNERDDEGKGDDIVIRVEK